MENNIKTEAKTGTNLLKGVGIALIFTFVSLLIFSIILTYTSLSQSYIPIIIMVVTGISILLGSFIGNIKTKKNGILNGGLIGAIYMIIIYLISSLLNWKFGLNIQSIIMIATGFICGCLGGVFGVNKTHK